MKAKRQLTEAAQVAAIIRAELKKHGIQARVKSSNFSMGDSVTVSLNDELPGTVNKIKEFVDSFQGGYFDSMQDMYVSCKTDGPSVKFASVDIEYSDELKQECWEWCLNYYSTEGNEPRNLKDAGSTWLHNEWAGTFVWRVLRQDGPFWRTRKPRIQLAA